MEYIRKATPGDAERIGFIAEQCWQFASGQTPSQKTIRQALHDFYSNEKLTHEINNNIAVFLLVIDGEQPVAFTSYTLRKNEAVTCEINAMYCLPETQGKRFDELLVREVIKNTIAAGGKTVFAVMTEDNGPVGLFERMGFETIKNDTPQPFKEITMMSKNIGNFRTSTGALSDNTTNYY